MKQRVIAGNSISAIGLGCMGMSQSYGPADEGESLRVLDRAIELGCNFWDTADMYGAGKNELLLAKALKKHRTQVFLATKVGNVYDRSLTSHQDQVQAGQAHIVDGTPKYIRKCMDLSLRRLGVEAVDLYYLHRVDPLVPIDETVGAMAELVTQGKARYLGLSEAGAATIRRAALVHPIAALQSEYSLWTRHVEKEILPTCRELGIAFVPFSPLGRGFLTGAVQTTENLPQGDFRLSSPRFHGENFQKNLEIVEVIKGIAGKHAVTPAQVALAWVLAQGEDILPIPGTKRVAYLEQNLAAADVQLSVADLEKLGKIQVHGARYSEENQRFVQE